MLLNRARNSQATRQENRQERRQELARKVVKKYLVDPLKERIIEEVLKRFSPINILKNHIEACFPDQPFIQMVLESTLDAFIENNQEKMQADILAKALPVLKSFYQAVQDGLNTPDKVSSAPQASARLVSATPVSVTTKPRAMQVNINDLVSAELLKESMTNQQLVAQIVLQVDLINIELFIKLLDKFTFSKNDIQKLAYASGLKRHAYTHLSQLPPNIESLALLRRSVNQDLSIGAFFWKRTGFLFKDRYYKEGSKKAQTPSPTVSRIETLILNMERHVVEPQVRASPILASDVVRDSIEDRLSDDSLGPNDPVSNVPVSNVPGTFFTQPAPPSTSHYEMSYETLGLMAKMAMGGLLIVLMAVLYAHLPPEARSTHNPAPR